MIDLKSSRFISSFVHCRHMATYKRFFRNTGILSNGDKYEITLDQKKLKTPLGKVFEVNSKPLALAVAHEWDSQKELINRNFMHLTALCSTVQDNPNKLTKAYIANYIVNFLETDTLLFQSNGKENEIDDLYKLQEDKWDPLIQWFCDRYQVDIEKTKTIDAPIVLSSTKHEITKHLLSYNDEAVFGFMYGVDTVKSVILTLAASERRITIEEAVALSRLEEEYQISHWGNIEWSHELSKYDLQSRMAAAILFIHFNSYFKTNQLKTKTTSIV
ncbi:PREDICTED: ATP synthase mitochondrial F1 complex assembly factor 2 [Ceratosolen solmsi marchali]|uniref:ATP synthase mitochondrial F1 complex assembly factor 2 n=1 Tax=Ceratosolen solmsi marchali TaxID=326594 RepID=A0AAJ6YXD6_9HYME|nr:PREDICTED: ATP synthase mitochondrial F1 complex assembly factor 2 [Ceratosolen solmsi marchali]XP_011506119.1 PREDICTED: ATP synthase mitochondrial F1 complex assembly factor 2 [Ceratosolen solmsi marchali]